MEDIESNSASVQSEANTVTAPMSRQVTDKSSGSREYGFY